MRSRIEKTNKTKFDYTSRLLGFIGIIIIAVTFIVGGHTLMSISNENNALLNLINNPGNNDNVQMFKVNDDLQDNQELEIIVEE